MSSTVNIGLFKPHTKSLCVWCFLFEWEDYFFVRGVNFEWSGTHYSFQIAAIHFIYIYVIHALNLTGTVNIISFEPHAAIVYRFASSCAVFNSSHDM